MAYRKYRKYNGGGFYNYKTGRWVSGLRAHQKVGESIYGYTKRMTKDGRFYFTKDDDDDDDDYYYY